MAYQGTPLDKLILGSRENIAKISRDDLADVRNAHCIVGQNTIALNLWLRLAV
eukprot:COSAG02_NODE_2632_length_8381_cov_1.693552_7_plen_53_part_00